MAVNTVYGKFTVDEAFKWPPCMYCDNEGLPFADKEGTWWLCKHHRELRQSGWLDLVRLVEESIGG
jgi:hypothetical protein